jgi:hypothetical protein
VRGAALDGRLLVIKGALIGTYCVSSESLPTGCLRPSLDPAPKLTLSNWEKEPAAFSCHFGTIANIPFADE